MGDDEEMVSSVLLESSLQDVNEQTIDDDKFVAEELNNGDIFPCSDIYLDSTVESKSNEAACVERNLDTGDVKEMAIDAGIEVTEKKDKDFPGKGEDELLSNSLDSGAELVDQDTVLEVVKEALSEEGVTNKPEDEMIVKEELPEDGVTNKPEDEMVVKEELPEEGVTNKQGNDLGNGSVAEEEIPALDTELETSTGVGGQMTTSVVSDDHYHPTSFDLASSNPDTHFDRTVLLDTTKGCGEIKYPDVQVTSSESALEVADVCKLEVTDFDKPEVPGADKPEDKPLLDTPEDKPSFDTPEDKPSFDTLEDTPSFDTLEVDKLEDKMEFDTSVVGAGVDKPAVDNPEDKPVLNTPEVDKPDDTVVEVTGVDRPEVIAEVTEFHKLEVANNMSGSVSVEEHVPITRSEDLQIMAVESLQEDQHQKALMDPVEHAMKSAVGDLKVPVIVSDAMEISGAVLPVGLNDTATDVIVATWTEFDADTSAEAAKVIKGEQDARIDEFPVLGSESIRVVTEVGQDRRCAEGEIVIRDPEKVEVMELDPSEHLEMHGLELGDDEPVVALRTEEDNKVKMAEAGVEPVVAFRTEEDKAEMEEAGEETVVALRTEEDKVKMEGASIEDPQAIKESKTDIDGSNNEESVGKLQSLEVVSDDQEDDEIVTGKETGFADTDLVTESDAGESVKATDTDMETETYAGNSGKTVGGKRKKGKISKVPGNTKLATRAHKATDEDVCFICFDGGELFICDRRGCGKAYHPSCVDRDEAFFRAKGRWNCGWHLCGKCGKNAHYMCYTCPFSLCKACTKDAVILLVRRNKGFCETCMRTVLLIENHDSNLVDAKIDFDDKSSWEFLYKDYYTDLKSKLGLSFAEIAEAKNPWKGSEAVTVKEDSPEAAVGANSNEGSGSGSDNHAESQEASKPKRRKNKKRLKTVAKSRVSSSSAASVPDDDGISGPGSMEWASNEVIELVMHMKDGDRSPLSKFDVQDLLLEYVNKNKLRDPRRKSQIICDSRLEKLFGKTYVGHFEMLKLLESHLPVKDDSQADDVQGSTVDNEANNLEANENAETPTKRGIKDKKRKQNRKGIGRGPEYSRYEFAAIDMHNINLIYLRRKLMEDLLDDTDEFSNKVVGTFVRIRISGSMQKQDLYRLVLVVGTSKSAEPYKMGKRTTDLMLEILNLNKTEIVSIDSVSNQEFTEEECNRLRQSIKCGLLNRMTVGDILDKATDLQEARVNDWLESEIMRLSHLRDRASDMGRKKQLRECVEKLQILKTPEERQRRLDEVPQVHSDPNMDPNHESEEEDSEHDDTRQVFMKTKSSGFTRRGGGSDFSPRDSWSVGKFSNKNRDFDSQSYDKRYAKGEVIFQGIDMDNSRNRIRDREVKDDHLLKLSSPTQPDNVNWSGQQQPVARSDKLLTVGSVDSPLSVSAKLQGNSSAVGPMTPTPANEASSVKVNETQKIWHYKDPSGKVQGPFSIVQLRKWSNTGYFPAVLKIWKAGNNPDDSILLTDVLAGRFPESLPSVASAISNTKIGSDLSHLPSPTPTHGNNVGRKGDDELAISATSYPGNIQSPAATSVGHPNLSLGQTSTHNSAEQQVIRGPETDFTNSRAGFSQTPSEQNMTVSVNALHGSLFSSSSEKHNDMAAATTTLPIQQFNGQDSYGGSGTTSWVEPASQKMDTNLLVPVTPQPYDQRGAITSTVQNTNTNTNLASFSNSGLVLPQPQENWRPTPMQVDQSNNNMQQPVPNYGWGNMAVDPNSAATTPLRPGNPNIGWGPPPMQGGGMNGGWVGQLQPPPQPTNMNWGPVVQGPGVNTNPGWVMGNMNLPTTVQGPNMGNMNPGWYGPPPPGNMMGGGVQGLVPAVATSGWVPPVANMASGVQPPSVPGNGWAMKPTGNPGGGPPPPSQGSTVPGNNNQGWGGQQHQGGDQYSGEINQGYQGGGDSRGGGYGSFGRGGGGGYGSFGRGGGGHGGYSRGRRDMMCPYNNNGRCRKGASCNYRHA